MIVILTQAVAERIEALREEDHDVYINDILIDNAYTDPDTLVVEVEGNDREIPFGEIIDVRVFEVIRQEVRFEA